MSDDAFFIERIRLLLENPSSQDATIRFYLTYIMSREKYDKLWNIFVMETNASVDRGRNTQDIINSTKRIDYTEFTSFKLGNGTPVVIQGFEHNDFYGSTVYYTILLKIERKSNGQGEHLNLDYNSRNELLIYDIINTLIDREQKLLDIAFKEQFFHPVQQHVNDDEYLYFTNNDPSYLNSIHKKITTSLELSELLISIKKRENNTIDYFFAFNLNVVEYVDPLTYPCVQEISIRIADTGIITVHGVGFLNEYKNTDGTQMNICIETRSFPYFIKLLENAGRIYKRRIVAHILDPNIINKGVHRLRVE